MFSHKFIILGIAMDGISCFHMQFMDIYPII